MLDFRLNGLVLSSVKTNLLTKNSDNETVSSLLYFRQKFLCSRNFNSDFDFSTHALVAQTEVCDTMISFATFNEPPALSCADVTITMHVGSTSGEDAATASLAFPTTSSITNAYIMVSGTFTIDKSFTFIDCYVFFNENAEMVTLEDEEVDLVGINTWFTNCEEKAWKSIQIRANGAIRFENCRIIGALDGLDFRKDYRAPQSMLKGNKFRRNRYSIVSQESGTVLTFTEFIQNDFSGFETVPGTTTLPHSGIRLTGCNAIIGTPFIYDQPSDYSLFANLFINLRFGIEAYGISTVVYVANCRFAFMRQDLQYNGSPIGCGINAIGATLSVSAYYDLDAEKVYGYCSFFNCASAGIRANQCKLNVNRATFSGDQIFGISSKLTGFRTQTIERCTFDVGGYALSRAGIFMERPNGSGRFYSTRINNNKIELINNLGSVAGIDIRCPVASTDHMSVNNNNTVIKYSAASNPYYGTIIYGGQSSNIELKGNTITTPNPSDYAFGIFMANLEGFWHLLDGNNSTGGAQCNYHLEKSRNVKYCDNISDGGTHGFHFHGDNDNTNWSINEIGAHNRGLLIADIPNPGQPPLSSGRISQQTRRGNLWEADGNQYGDKAARCDAIPIFSKFEIEDNNSQRFPTKIEPASGWFSLVSGTTEHCIGVTKHISSFEDELASGGSLSISEAEEWEATRLLLETLLRYPGQMTGDTALQAFYAQSLTSTAGQFAQLNQMLEAGGFSTSTLWDVRETKETQFEAAKFILDSINTRAVLSDLDSNIYYPGDTMLPIVHADMLALADSIEILESALSNMHDTVLMQALLELDSITTTEAYEEAYKILRTYQIKIALGYEPDEAGYADLMEVADSAEADYGGAVRHARHYLSDCDRYARIAPDETGGSEAERPLATTNSVLPPVISIFPNPAANSIRVTKERLGSSTWSILSAVGSLARTGTWPSDQPDQQIDLDGLAPGTYYFIVRSDAGPIHARKLIVLH